MTKEQERVIKILDRYCTRIRYNRKHYVLYPRGSRAIITMSASPSDRNWMKALFQEFKRNGIIIRELEDIVK